MSSRGRAALSRPSPVIRAKRSGRNVGLSLRNWRIRVKMLADVFHRRHSIRSASSGRVAVHIVRPSFRTLLCGMVWAGGVLLPAAPRPPDIPFAIHLIDPGASETAAVADINRDGKLDIVSGEFWYEAPSWTKHRFRELTFTGQYIDDFSDL